MTTHKYSVDASCICINPEPSSTRQQRAQKSPLVSDGDGDIDLDDFNLLAADYGSGSPESASGLPEPAAASLIALACGALVRSRSS